jgi:hypothetical protein
LIEQKNYEFPRTTTPDSLVRPEVVPSMKKRHSLGTLMLVLALASWLHAMNRISGHVTQIGDNQSRNSARFYPRAPFTNRAESLYLQRFGHLTGNPVGTKQPCPPFVALAFS